MRRDLTMIRIELHFVLSIVMYQHAAGAVISDLAIVERTRTSAALVWESSIPRFSYIVLYKKVKEKKYMSFESFYNFLNITELSPGTEYIAKVVPYMDAEEEERAEAIEFKTRGKMSGSSKRHQTTSPSLPTSTMTSTHQVSHQSTTTATTVQLSQKPSTTIERTTTSPVPVTTKKPTTEYQTKSTPAQESADTVVDIENEKTFESTTQALPTTTDVPTTAMMVTTTYTGLTQVTNLRVEVKSATYAKIAWNPVPGITRYFIKYKRMYDEDHHVITSTENHVHLTELRPSSSYDVQVLTNKNAKASEIISIIFATRVTKYLQGAPLQFSTASTSNTTIELTWKEVTDARNYHIAYRLSSTSKWHVDFASHSPHVLQQLKPRSEYEVKIQVGNSPSGPGKWSDIHEIKTRPSPPSPPRNPGICDEHVQAKKDNVVLCWQKPSSLIDQPDPGMSYTILWCAHNEVTTEAHGCKASQDIPHNDEDLYQAHNLYDLPFDVSVWYEITAYASDGQLGGNVSGEFKTSSNPNATSAPTQSNMPLLKIITQQQRGASHTIRCHPFLMFAATLVLLFLNM